GFHDGVAIRFGVRALADGRHLGAEGRAFTGDLFQLRRIAGGERRVGAGGRQHLCGKLSERAGRAGDDGALATDVEQREGIFEQIVGHGVTYWALTVSLAPPRPAWGEVDLRAEHLRSQASRVRGRSHRLRLAEAPPHPDSIAPLRYARNPTSPRTRGEVEYAA